ncbi:MAG: type II toxin-antitoxin system prevent-host-death family antitoxin [Spirochaetales bacterium]|nr:type II toxin-antitoxin system prevent-host-death family antitoxin [Spirochaetales bacterium]
MDAVNYSDLRQNLKKYLDYVYNDHEPLIVTRKNNENVVILSVDDFNALNETQYLVSTKNNAEHLQNSLNQLRSGKGFTKELIEE